MVEEPILLRWARAEGSLDEGWTGPAGCNPMVFLTLHKTPQHVPRRHLCTPIPPSSILQTTKQQIATRGADELGWVSPLPLTNAPKPLQN